MNIEFSVIGEPVGKGRPRFTRSGHAFTPSQTVQYEKLVVSSFQSKYGLQPIYGEKVPISIEITAVYSIPKSFSKVKRKAALNGTLFPTKKPDWDNIGKIICDALNGVAYKDDAQIVDAHAYKRYGENPHVEVKIQEVKIHEQKE